MTSLVLWVPSTIWSGLSAFARLLIGFGILRPSKLPARVISVGNIQAGGAGKTPLVARIANEATARGKSVCILCRGYGARWERQGGILAPGDPAADPRDCGDEPALLHELAPGAFIGVAADRAAAFSEVVKKRGGEPVDLAVLDDGFQNFRVRKDLEIVAWTSRTRGEVLFRDFASALGRADLVVWTKGKKPPSAGRPFVRVRYRLPRPDPDRGFDGFWFVTGIADGEAAVDLARQEGYAVKKHIRFADHEPYSEEAVRSLLSRAAREGCKVAVTGKDWVKWRVFGVSREEVTVLEPELVFAEGGEIWDRVLWGN